MTERDITGDVRSAYKRAQLIAKDRNLTDIELRDLADGVREFDAQRSSDLRLASALEKLTDHFTNPHVSKDRWDYENQRLRRREVYAQELMAVAMLADDVADEALATIRQTNAFKNLVTRLSAPFADGPA